MSFRLSQRSRARLAGVHPDLVAVVEAAIRRTEVDFMVTEGLRDPGRQAALVRAGASRTLNSRHLTGHAVDVAALLEGRCAGTGRFMAGSPGPSRRRRMIWARR